jgi:hypothetical protein
MENKSKSTLEEEFNKFFQEPQTQPSQQQSESTPPTDVKQDSAETKTDPNEQHSTEKRPWLEHVIVTVYDRTDAGGVETRSPGSGVCSMRRPAVQRQHELQTRR